MRRSAPTVGRRSDVVGKEFNLGASGVHVMRLLLLPPPSVRPPAAPGTEGRTADAIFGMEQTFTRTSFPIDDDRGGRGVIRSDVDDDVAPFRPTRTSLSDDDDGKLSS